MKRILNYFKAMSFPFALRTRRVLIFCLFSVIAIVDCLNVQLHARTQVEAQCGEDVKLMCNVSSSQQMDVKVLSWLAFNRTLCEYERNRTEKEFHCETTKLKDDQTLTLKLNNVMPVNTGKYLCKVQSTAGVNSSTTMVTIQECKGRSTASKNKSHAECSFKGVYPSGSVHWFQGNTNLTNSSSTKEIKDQHGLYNIHSTLDVKGEHLQLQHYNCSLWVPSLRKYLSWQQPPLVEEVGSSAGSATVRLKTGLCMMIVRVMQDLL